MGTADFKNNIFLLKILFELRQLLATVYFAVRSGPGTHVS